MANLNAMLENGPAICTIIEGLGYNHDAGAYAMWVRHDGKEFMVVRSRGEKVWRKWSSVDRTQPIVEHLEREAKQRAEQSSE